tara:strand:+ start:82 stop:330 length:249 start_codon:yes stop_codon:yes gene_type:complete
MKITKSELQNIIKEELLKEFEGDAPYDSYGGPLARALDLLEDGYNALTEYIENQEGDYHPLQEDADSLRMIMQAIASEEGKN